MAAPRRDHRFVASPQGQVVTLLRRGLAAVEEPARAVGLTDTAVRAHLVVQRGGRPDREHEERNRPRIAR